MKEVQDKSYIKILSASTNAKVLLILKKQNVLSFTFETSTGNLSCLRTGTPTLRNSLILGRIGHEQDILFS